MFVRRSNRTKSQQIVAEEFLRSGEDQDGFKLYFIDSYKGCGVITTKEFSRGDFLLEYQGDLVNEDEGEKRHRRYTEADGSFLYFFNFKGSKYCVDATNEGHHFQLARFVNDSRSRPNSKMRVIEVENTPHLALFALRALDKNEEVLFDYGDASAYWRKLAYWNCALSWCYSCNILGSCPSVRHFTTFGGEGYFYQQLIKDGVEQFNIHQSREIGKDGDYQIGWDMGKDKYSGDGIMQNSLGSRMENEHCVVETYSNIPMGKDGDGEGKCVNLNSAGNQAEEQMKSNVDCSTANDTEIECIISDSEESIDSVEYPMLSNSQENTDTQTATYRNLVRDGDLSSSAEYEPNEEGSDPMLRNSQENTDTQTATFRNRVRDGDLPSPAEYEPNEEGSNPLLRNSQENTHTQTARYRNMVRDGDLSSPAEYEPNEEGSDPLLRNSQENTHTQTARYRNMVRDGDLSSPAEYEPNEEGSDPLLRNSPENTHTQTARYRNRVRDGDLSSPAEYEPNEEVSDPLLRNSQENTDTQTARYRNRVRDGDLPSPAEYEPNEEGSDPMLRNSQENTDTQTARYRNRVRDGDLSSPAEYEPNEEGSDPMLRNSQENTDTQTARYRNRVRDGDLSSPAEYEPNEEGSDPMLRNSQENTDTQTARYRNRVRDGDLSSPAEYEPNEEGSDPMLRNSQENTHTQTARYRNRVRDGDLSSSAEYEPNEEGSDDEEFINDRKNTGLFMPALKRNPISKRGVRKKSTRVWNKQHACFYCSVLMTNISKHLRTHREAVEIKAILDMESNTTLDKKKVGTDVKFQLSLLRNKGDHKHNISVLDKGKGHLIVARRNGEVEFNSDDYSPCPYCLIWIKESDVYKHKVYRCLFKSSNRKPSTGRLVNQGRILKGSLPFTSQRVVNEVFPSMTRDLITRTAQTDSLIVELGEEWLRKASRNKLRRKNYASTHMRRAAKVLHICRILDAQNNRDPAVSFQEFLAPSKFDIVVMAAVKAAGGSSDEIDDDMLHPSTAIKFGHDLVRMAETKEATAIKRGEQALRSEASDFLTLISKEWPSKVAITSQRISEERRYKKKIILPPVEDLKILSQYLQAELAALAGCLHSVSWETYQRAVRLIQVRLVTFNKRRPGELEAMTLDSYNLRHTSTDVLQKDILEDLSTLEKHLHQTHDLVTVRGKRGASVPVLIPLDVKKAIEYITDEEVRKIGTSEDNKEYLFANSGRGVFRVCDSLRELRMECNVELGLTNPDLLCCTLLRKYMATATQMLSVNDQELHWIVKHLGHSVTVHDQYYRVMSSTLERAKIAKLLVLADQGMLGKFKGQSLEEINFDDIQLQKESVSNPSVVDVTLQDIVDDLVEHGSEDEENQMETVNRKATTQDEDDVYEPSEEEEAAAEGASAVKRKSTWSEGESWEIEKFFKSEVIDLKAPGKAACLTFINLSKHKSNRKRTWTDIKNKVNALVQKEKRKQNK